MLSTMVQTLFVLPALLLVSVPLALSASITMLFAFAALFLRAFIVYIELASALLINFSSFRRIPPQLSLFGVFRSQYSGRVAVKKRVSWASVDPLARAFFNFISGDAERDFEGVGGWRTPLQSRKRDPNSSSPPGSYSTSEEGLLDDEQAWSSLNNRLELPSKQLNFVPPSALPPPPPQQQTAADTSGPKRPRYHKRSITTSSLTPQGTSSPNLPPFSEEKGSNAAATTRLQTSKSSAGLESLLPASSKRPHSPSLTSSDYHPFLMTTNGSSDELRMAHYPSFARRRSSASSSSQTTRSFTGLGLS